MTTTPHPTVHGFLRIIEGKPRGYAEQRQSPEDLALMTVDEHFQRMSAHIAAAEQVASPPDQESHIPAQTIAEAAVEQLIKSGAEHYQEFQFDIHIAGRTGARPVVVTVAFSDGPSAHELRLKAEQERDTVLAALAALGKREPVYTKPSWVDSYGWSGGYIDFKCATDVERLARHFEDLLDAVPEGPLYDSPVAQAGQAPAGYALVPDHPNADAIVTALYRRFKDWSARGFGPEDVTWCEVKADLLALIAAAPAQGGE